MGFQLYLENNVMPIWTGDSLSPSVFAYDKFKAHLSLDLLYNQQVKTWIDSTLKAGTGALVRVQATSGVNIATLDFAGVLADEITRYPNESGAKYVNVKL